MSSPEESILKWAMGVVTTLWVIVLGWTHVRINRVDDKKLSKEVFEEFKEANENYHKATHERLDEIVKKLDG